MQVTAGSTRAISPARRAAFATLEAVEEGAYASDVLRERSQSLSARDAGLAGQIVFGSLRYQGQLDYLIHYYSGRTASELDRAVRLALRSAIFQLRYLTRIPPHAAVHESVEYVKAFKRAAAGLTNAVLRKVKKDPVQWPDLATVLSCPAWMLARWSEHFGIEQARAIASTALTEPPAFIRIPIGTPLPDGVALEPTSVPGAYRADSELPAGVRLHDISSQSIIPLLGLQRGMSYLDLCAAPGNKTLQALETGPALAVACDISWKRLGEVPAVCPRVVLDATETLPFAIPFDRVFIDAPCSGTGTLARNPEIKWRLQEHDLRRFGQRQLAILSQAARALAGRGKLVYATCSLEREENEDVVQEFLRAQPRFACTQEIWRLPGRDEGDGFYAAVLEPALSSD